MRHLFILTIIAAFGFTMLGIVSDADARRFGGGMSFGKQRMKQSTPRMQRQSTTQKSAAAGQRGAARTGMMGMIGGLALGGLLGAMFFGGAFEGINFFDILILGGGLMLLFWFMRRKSQPMTYANPYDQSSQPHGNGDANIHSPQGEQVTGGKMLRPDINEKHFIEAARDIYMRMQKAWDSGDAEDIRAFCTTEIADRIARDMQETPTNLTEVATLNAKIADSWIESDLEWVAVNYTAMLREQTLDENGTSIEDETAEVNEIWIFQHNPQSEDPTWYLAGIQQVN